MSTLLPTDPSTLIWELVGAIQDLGGPDALDVERLTSLTSAIAGWSGPLGGFRRQVVTAWEIARPPLAADLELIEAEQWDCGLIDWLDDDPIDVGGREAAA